ncbi:hypothetical protein AAHE18_13G234600 [Arachis hypogaea]
MYHNWLGYLAKNPTFFQHSLLVSASVLDLRLPPSACSLLLRALPPVVATRASRSTLRQPPLQPPLSHLRPPPPSRFEQKISFLTLIQRLGAQPSSSILASLSPHLQQWQ